MNVEFDDRWSMMGLEIGELYHFSFDYNYEGTPRQWIADAHDPRLKGNFIAILISHKDVLLVLERFSIGNRVYIEALTPRHGRVWIRGHWGAGDDIDPKSLAFKKV